MSGTILFDGVCHFCNTSVQFITKRDKGHYFKFASLQSEKGQQLLRAYKIEKNIESLVLIENNRFYIKSTAALMICNNLGGLWRLLSVLLIIPAPIRNIFYDWFAKNRYKWFGKMESCRIPSTEDRKRFLK